MVGGDEVDDAFADCFPQLFAVLRAADGWGAFVESAAVGDGFSGEVEVVGAGFDTDGEALFACLAEIVESLRGDEVDNVEGKAEFAAEADHEADGFHFGFVRTGA